MSYADPVTCPWCGYTIHDLWDYHWGTSDELRAWCRSCENPVVISRVVTCDYTIVKGPESST